MKKKITYLLVTLVSIAVLATGLVSHQLMAKSYKSNIERRLTTNGRIIREHILSLDEISISELRRFSAKVSEQIQARVTIIERDGTVIVDTEANPDELENHANRPEIKEAYKGKKGVSTRYSSTLELDMMYVAMPLEGSKIKGSVVRLALPLERVRKYEMQLYKQIALASFIFILFALMMGFKFVEPIVKPINELNDATKKIANGNLGEIIDIDAEDELEDLASNFNKMNYELDLMVKELNDRNIKMDTILSNMNNSLVALDNEYNIMFMNKTFEEEVGILEFKVKGKNFFDVIKNKKLKNAFREVLKTDDNFLEYHGDNNMIYNFYTNPIISKFNEPIGVLINIYDVTQMKKLEKMRSDFVANVSHELKTPLTSITGFVDTLKNGAIEDEEVRMRFLNIISAEAKRLNVLIEDILALSDIENNYLLMEKNPINVSELSHGVIHMLENVAEKKNIELINSIEEDIIINGNRRWIKQMIVNLVENAIKYTNADGTVELDLSSDVDNVYIKVIDNGIGISEEDQERLFERFYRVDKARSRDVGGTGLGLAIVKHVAIALNGNVSIESELGKGSTFIVQIRKS